MPDLTKEDIERIRQTHDDVIKIKTLLEGNGSDGVCQRVQNHGKRITKLEIIVAALVASGALGGGAFGIAKLIGG